MPAFDLIAFDADDTLWHNENLYTQGYQRFKEIMDRYHVSGDINTRQQEIEIENLQYYGYGVSGFVFSLIEAAIELTGGSVHGRDIQTLVDLSKEMFTATVSVFPEARSTLVDLAGRYPLILITKGDLRHQQAKLLQSGLIDYFKDVEVVSDKTPEIYARLLRRHRVEPHRFLMVGDSLRSDIWPVLEIGGWAVHIPTGQAWGHEMISTANLPQDRFTVLSNLSALAQWLAIREQASTAQPDVPG